MANDKTLLDDGRNGSSSMALLPAGAVEQRSADWGGSALLQPGQAAEPAAMDFMTYLHGLRRHWVLATALGFLCAALVGPAVWFGVGKTYVASILLNVAVRDPAILSATDNGKIDRDFFEIYKSTQQQWVTSRFVLLAALRKSEVAQLASVKKADQEGDAVQWLMEWLYIGFPGKAEIMQISVKRYNAQEAATLVKAVVEAYLGEVVNVEGVQKRKHLSELDRAYTEKETEIRGKREDLKKLAETLGTSDTEILNVQQKLALELLSISRRDAMSVQYEIRKLQAEMASHTAVLQSLENSEVNDAEVELMVLNDPIARQLFMELGWRKMQQIYTQGAVVPEAKSSFADRYQQDLNIMQQQYDERRAELGEMVKQKKRSEIMTNIQRLEAYIAVMREQEENTRKLVQQQLADAQKFGVSSVDIEMMRADIENLGTVLSGIATEREKLKVEIRSAPRVTAPYGTSPDIPEIPSNDMARIALTVLASLIGFCCPAVAIVFWDNQAKRINSSLDVSQGLGLPVIGSMPLIPSRVIHRLGSPSKRSQLWHMRLTESVDGIAARVLRKADMEQCRVVMVSSAIGGEGKTTLATQLAMSLARAGRTTVLVDFDLRRPAFDEVFGLPLEPGVCEALRRQNAVSALIHQVGAENLAVVTAGRWDRTALASLSNGAAAAMFKQLREDYEFVVVDTSPILPVADARFVSQHVDSVVLSIFRDVSEAPKIEAACDILSAFGVQSVEAVVTGSNDRMYGKHMGYESTISA